MQKPGMITGHKGVKYGLITRKDEKKPTRPNSGRLAAFGGDSESEEDDVEAQVARQAARKVADSKVHDMYAAALAEDPNAFEYDTLYDSMQEQKAAPKQQEKLARKPKYIASLLEQAEVRRREQGITYERVLLKERQKEDHMYDNTEKFITSAYKRKLEEDKQWQESQKLKELEEERNDVTKLGNMNNFFTNLTKNVAMGGTGATSSKRTAAAQPAAAVEQPVQGASMEVLGGPVQEHQQKDEQNADDAILEQQQQRHGQQQQQMHDQSELVALHSDQQQHTAPCDGIAPQAGVQPHPAGKNKQQQDQQQEQQPHATPNVDAVPQTAEAAAVSGKRKNTDDAIAAARERYLARKRQQQG